MENSPQNLVIYQTKDGALEFKTDSGNETIWATQAQIVELYGKDQSVISRHIKNIFTDQEVESESNMQKMHIANSDKPVMLYSLDIILAVGYRTNSARAISFRKWSTKTLRQHLTQGYTINPSVLQHNQKQFQDALQSLQKSSIQRRQ